MQVAISIASWMILCLSLARLEAPDASRPFQLQIPIESGDWPSQSSCPPVRYRMGEWARHARRTREISHGRGGNESLAVHRRGGPTRTRRRCWTSSNELCNRCIQLTFCSHRFSFSFLSFPSHFPGLPRSPSLLPSLLRLANDQGSSHADDLSLFLKPPGSLPNRI